MKTNTLTWKSILTLLVVVTSLLFTGCKSDDDNIPMPTIDEAPEIAAQTFTVAEDIADDTVIGKVTATDPENKALTFTLTKNSNDYFELTDTGELSLSAGKKLDFETTTSYTLSVEVSDGIHKASADITVAVENVAEAFITIWKTTEANETITIGVTKELTYDYTIDWGDGTIEQNQTTFPSHTYVTANTYTVKVTGKFPSISINVGKDAHKLQTIEQWGDIKWESFYGAFAGCSNMIYNAKDVPDLSQVTSIAGIFARCKKFNADLNDWDVSTIIDMRGVFVDASSFNGNISNWDVSKVTDMFGMFGECSKFNGDLSNWDVSNVTNMGGMFSHATSFTGDLNSWNVSKVTDMTDMFSGTDSFNGGLSKWDVSNVTKMIRMFINATSFNGDLSQWDVSNVTEMGQMFSGATSFNGDVSQWDVSNVTGMPFMFSDATSFNQDISDWDIQNVISMQDMLDNTKLSTVNYDALLTKWSALPNIQSNVTFGVEGLTYCNAQVARENLTGSKRWRIIGDTSCPR